jgi:hypothetical protein
MSDKQPVPCEHCKATGLFGGNACHECDGKGYRLTTGGRAVSKKQEQFGAAGGEPKQTAIETPVRLVDPAGPKNRPKSRCGGPGSEAIVR